MAIYTELLACTFISDAARKELARAFVPIHKGVPGIENDIEIVELRHAGEKDRGGLYVWGIPREIQIQSLGLYLVYKWDDEVNGYMLTWMDEDMGMVRTVIYEQVSTDDGLSDLDEHPF